MPLLLNSAYSAWSGQAFYDIYLKELYNVIFTCVPIIVYALFDQEKPKDELISRPDKYYKKSRSQKYLGRIYYATFATQGILHGAAIWVTAFYYFDSRMGMNGRISDMNIDGLLTYTVITFTVNLRLIFDSHV